jgi:hypothetical protein
MDILKLLIIEGLDLLPYMNFYVKNTHFDQKGTRDHKWILSA